MRQKTEELKQTTDCSSYCT